MEWNGTSQHMVIALKANLLIMVPVGSGPFLAWFHNHICYVIYFIVIHYNRFGKGYCTSSSSSRRRSERDEEAGIYLLVDFL